MFPGQTLCTVVVFLGAQVWAQNYVTTSVGAESLSTPTTSLGADQLGQLSYTETLSTATPSAVVGSTPAAVVGVIQDATTAASPTVSTTGATGDGAQATPFSRTTTQPAFSLGPLASGTVQDASAWSAALYSSASSASARIMASAGHRGSDSGVVAAGEGSSGHGLMVSTLALAAGWCITGIGLGWAYLV